MTTSTSEKKSPTQSISRIASLVESKASGEGVTLMEAYCLWRLNRAPGRNQPICSHASQPEGCASAAAIPPEEGV